MSSILGFAADQGISPSTIFLSSQKYVWAPPRGLACLLDIAPAFESLPSATRLVLAADQGLEPQLSAPEAGVLPLDESAILNLTMYLYTKNALLAI